MQCAQLQHKNFQPTKEWCFLNNPNERFLMQQSTLHNLVDMHSSQRLSLIVASTNRAYLLGNLNINCTVQRSQCRVPSPPGLTWFSLLDTALQAPRARRVSQRTPARYVLQVDPKRFWPERLGVTLSTLLPQASRVRKFFAHFSYHNPIQISDSAPPGGTVACC